MITASVVDFLLDKENSTESFEQTSMKNSGKTVFVKASYSVWKACSVV